MKKAIFIFGAPGSGKGTQADLLVWTQGFYHFDSGKYLRSILYDPASRNNKIIARERSINEKGILNTPNWVLRIFKREIGKIAQAGLSLVCSGSPRTMFEAFGDGKDKGLVDFLQRLYGVKNVFGIYLDVSPEVAAKRNRLRKTCNLCKNIVLVDVVIKKCPLCWGVLKAPDAMDPKKYKVRFDEFKIRTMPIINMLRRSGVKVVDVSGDGTPPEVFAKILKKINT